jgi:rubrerythrin
MAAAAMLAEEGISRKRLYNLTGGVMAWEGRTVSAFPRVRVFDHTRSPSELLTTAMDLEKGAWRFYRELLEKFGTQSFAEDMAHLVKAEAAHARSIYGIWQKRVSDPPPFEQLYEELRGDIMEGGERVADALERVSAVREDLCLNLMELALRIELSAYDLYRTMAEQTEDETARQAFFTIAQAEKSHMRSIARAIAKCPGLEEG